MTTLDGRVGHIFASIDPFYGERGGARSGERDFGVWWTLPPKGRYPQFRVSVVHDTGDVYAINMTTGAVELLATLEHTPVCGSDIWTGGHTALCAYRIAEGILQGWTEQIHDAGSLKWVRERLA